MTSDAHGLSPVGGSTISAPPELTATPLPRRLPQPGWWLACGCVLTLFALHSMIGIIYAIIVMITTGQVPQLSSGVALLIFAASTSTLLFALMLVPIFAWRHALRAFALKHCPPVHVLWAIAAAPPGFVVAIGIAEVLSKYTQSVSIEAIESAASQPLWQTLLFLAVMPALSEEIIFRGIIGRGLVARFGVLWGVLLTTLLFCVMHADPVQSPAVFTYGVVFHAFLLLSRSLWVAIAAHFSVNSFVFLTHYATQAFEDHQELASLTDHIGVGLWSVSVLTVLATVWAAYRTRVRYVLADGEFWTPGYPTAESPDVSAQHVLAGGALGPGLVVAACYVLFITTAVYQSLS